MAYPDIDFAKLKDVGVNLDRGDTNKIFEALADDINTKGGINGRDLDVAVVGYNLLDQANTEAACVKMTEDLKVFAVLRCVRGPVRIREQVHHRSQDGADGRKSGAFGRDQNAMDIWHCNRRTFRGLVRETPRAEGRAEGQDHRPEHGTRHREDHEGRHRASLKKAGYPAKVFVVNDATDVTQSDANWNVYAEKFKSAG